MGPTIKPASIGAIKSLELLKQTVIKQHGKDDHEVYQMLFSGAFSEEVKAKASEKGGIHEIFEKKGFNWSTEASKWFCQWEYMPVQHAVMVQILLSDRA